MIVAHEQIRVWLGTSDAIRSACDLDLLRFFARHSNSLLTTEQIANFVGYGRSEIDETLEHLLSEGLVTRVRGHSAEVDLYVMEVSAGSGSSGASLSSLLELASTRDGRLAVIDALRPARIAKGVTNAES